MFLLNSFCICNNSKKNRLIFYTLYNSNEFRYNTKNRKGKSVNTNNKHNEIIELLTSSGSAIDVGENIQRAIYLAHEIKEDEVGSMGEAEDAIVSYYDTTSLCVSGVAHSLGGMNKIDSMHIYYGYKRNNDTSQVGGGLVICNEDTPLIKISGLYRDIGNIGEIDLECILLALRLASTQLQHTKDITIYSTSGYSINSVSVWAYKWKTNGWRKSGGAIKNLKIIKEAHELYDKIRNKVSFCVIDTKDQEEESNEAFGILKDCRTLGSEAIKEKTYGAKAVSIKSRREK